VTAEAQNPNGRFFAGTPRTSDGSLLFLQHMISKMEEKGSRIGIVFNGSPLFTGDAGSGESEIRRWIIENDWLECIEQQQLILERKFKDRKLPARLRTHPPGQRHRPVLPARSQATSAQQLDGPQQRQNRVRNQLHQILLQIQTPTECGRNHQRPAGVGEGE